MLVSYPSIHLIRDGDLLLFRRRGLISIAGRGEHEHAAKAAWWGNDLFCLEVREWFGGRAVRSPARSPGTGPHRRVPGQRPEPLAAVRCHGATHFMRRLCGCDYGYRALLTVAMLDLPLVGLLFHPNLDDDATDRWPPFCSEACSMADRLGGGVDPVEHLCDALTEPADLRAARSIAIASPSCRKHHMVQDKLSAMSS